MAADGAIAACQGALAIDPDAFRRDLDAHADPTALPRGLAGLVEVVAV